MKTTDGRSEQADPEKGPSLRLLVAASAEGRLILAGAFLSVALAAWIGLAYLQSPDQSNIIGAMTVTHVLFGRAAGMAFGYSLNLGHGIVIPVNMLIETILVFFFYPIFVFSWNHLVEIRFMKRFMGNMRKTAEANQGRIRKYGIPGLFIFVWFPFWMTGPLVGSAIGYLLGMRIAANMGVVLTGTYIAIACWGAMLKEFESYLAEKNPYAPLVFVGILVGMIGLIHLIHCGKKKYMNSKKERKDAKS